ncbi:SRPBCC family protein [Plantactinospora soyae]|uniref:Uncharacterized protein YndB with AHSA1/START domain n=1 Tax=Plantactinospora soyae TaxID=1544732 RepID=A0A927MF24_9ACTN|nr:SRPBCC domain-containing protein [Plantactinospora soyae]MBE1492582.1 uncharacterized protein YndB with AHSA1/START domain [Plantactinospora soyae]
MTESRPDSRAFTITRVFDAPRELVFRAWTDPEHLARWFGPRGITVPRSTISMDVRAGGRWQLRMVGDDDGAEYPVAFVYREIVEPERLVFDTVPASGPENAGAERAVVTVTFADLGPRTEMTFHAAGVSVGEESAGLADGWSSSFVRLAEQLPTVGQPVGLAR